MAKKVIAHYKKETFINWYQELQNFLNNQIKVSFVF